MKWKKYLLCLGAGAVFYLAAEAVSGDSSLENGVIKRNPCGQGDAEYHFYVDGLEEKPVAIDISLPEQKLTKEQGEEILPHAVELLCERSRGENPSFSQVQTDLDLQREIPEYGITVSWESDRPELVSSMGMVYGTGAYGVEECLGDRSVETVHLKATLSNGIFEETVVIPVQVFPRDRSEEEKFREILEAAAVDKREEAEIRLPKEFEERALSYRDMAQSGNEILLALGGVGAVCLYLKEKDDEKKQRKKRENRLLFDYSEILSRFAVLTGAGYPTRQAWKKMVLDYERKISQTKDRAVQERPVYAEMRMALNQMETGIPEIQAYGEFGRRCGLRCYLRFVSLLENNLNTGGSNLRRLLEAEVENAFAQRKDMAMRLGEEASTKLLLPLFLMLGVVMVMIVAPAFLTLG